MLCIFLLLLSITYAQDAYVQAPGAYTYATAADANTACENISTGSYSLCSFKQLYRLVYGNHNGYSIPSLCFSGWTTDNSDFQYGWWMADENACGGQTGWRDWTYFDSSLNAVTPGGHCCLSTVEELTPQQCSDRTDICGDGFQNKDNFDNIYCTDGNCTTTDCCDPFTAAPMYRFLPEVPVAASYYVYDSKDAADAACRAHHEHMQLCTWDQIVGITKADEARMCTFGWFDDGESGNRGFYVSEAAANQGYCQGRAGERLAPQPANNMGSAHCCVPSYNNDGRDILSPSTGPNAEAYCQQNDLYRKTLCHKDQLQTISMVENVNICEGGWVRTDDDASGFEDGWWQGDSKDSNGQYTCGTPGWKPWGPEGRQTAHCCASYVRAYEPELGEYGRFPESYPQSTFSTGEEAHDHCVAIGYAGLCTKGQVGFVGSDTNGDHTDMCEVGWAKLVHSDGSFDYINGYYHTTASCGPAETWISGDTAGLTGSGLKPLAHCCMAVTSTNEITFMEPAYVNGNWDYNYSTMSDAAAKCSSLSVGSSVYSLCSQEQIYTVAVHGAPNSDGTTMVASNICRNGWHSGDSWGWWQGNDQCGSTGWRSFTSTTGKYGYHCCLNDFAAQPLPVPTMAPTTGTMPAFTKATEGTYTLYSEALAADACKTLHEEYRLCTDAEVVMAAIDGVAGDGDSFRAVEPQNDLCYAGWVDSTNSCPGTIKGWYQVNARQGCGDQQWNTYSPSAPQGSGYQYKAGAYCCAPHVAVEYSTKYDSELECDRTTTEPPVPEYQDASTELGVSDVYVRIGETQYYVKEGDNYVATCVGAGDENAACDNSQNVCGGNLRLTYGSVAQRTALVEEAKADGNVHSACPPANCTAYNGYVPEGFSTEVSYCKTDDGSYYWNGQNTCVTDSNSSDVNASLQAAFETDFQFLSPTCPNKDDYERPHDQVMSDQLHITEKMVSDLESKVNGLTDVNQQLTQAEAELQVVWNNWEAEITEILEQAKIGADQETVNAINQVLTDLNDLNTNP